MCDPFQIDHVYVSTYVSGALKGEIKGRDSRLDKRTSTPMRLLRRWKQSYVVEVMEMEKNGGKVEERIFVDGHKLLKENEILHRVTHLLKSK